MQVRIDTETLQFFEDVEPKSAYDLALFKCKSYSSTHNAVKYLLRFGLIQLVKEVENEKGVNKKLYNITERGKDFLNWVYSVR